MKISGPLSSLPWPEYRPCFLASIALPSFGIHNKRGGHGQVAVPVSVPDYLVSYALYETAATIIFLAEAEKKLK